MRIVNLKFDREKKCLIDEAGRTCTLPPYNYTYISDQKLLRNSPSIQNVMYHDFTLANVQLFSSLIAFKRKNPDVDASDRMAIIERYWSLEHFYFEMISQRDDAIKAYQDMELRLKFIEKQVSERDKEIKKLLTVIENT